MLIEFWKSFLLLPEKSCKFSPRDMHLLNLSHLIATLKIGKEEALKKAKERRSMSSIQLFPLGTVTYKFKKIYHFWVHCSYFSHCILVSEQTDLQKNVNASTDAGRTPLRTPRKTPTCRTCGEPMKGHRKNQCNSQGE